MTFKRLISEDGESVSLGRISFWAIFPIMIFYWTYGWIVLDKDAPSSLVAGFSSILLYNLGKKFQSKNNLKD
jgi:hypothetical protein